MLTSGAPPAGRLSGVSIRDLDPSSLGCIELIPILQRRQTNQPRDLAPNGKRPTDAE